MSARPDVLARVSRITGPNKPLALSANAPEDPVKTSAGLYEDWPNDRSVLVGDDDSFVVNVNGDEHLEVCVVTNDSLRDAFDLVCVCVVHICASLIVHELSGAVLFGAMRCLKAYFLNANLHINFNTPDASHLASSTQILQPTGCGCARQHGSVAAGQRSERGHGAGLRVQRQVWLRNC